MSDYDSSINLNPVEQSEENKLVNKALTKLPIPHFSGLKLEADIKIGTLVLNTIDEETGVVWVCTDIQGWWNLPDPELPDLPRGWGDGSYDAKGRWASRILTLNGSFLTQDPDQVEAARAKLLDAISLVYRGDWLVVNETPVTKGTFVRLSGRPEIDTVSARGRTNFSIGLKAADPIKYEYIEENSDGYNIVTLTANSSGDATATITNAGNVSVPIIVELAKSFTIPAPSDPPTITNATSDQAITIIAGTSSTNQLEIDTYNREVLEVEYLAGQVVSVENGRAKVSILIDWIYLEPGTNTIELTNFPASSICKIYYRSGWIG
jgi:hypothetical protein